MKLRRTKGCSYCPHCRKLEIMLKTETQPYRAEIQATIDRLKAHVELATHQSLIYKQVKKELVDKEIADRAVVVMDFTCIDINCHSWQDLIVCVYRYDATSNDKLRRQYRHLIAPSTKTKNNTCFVFGAWAQIIGEGFFQGIKEISLWSDGGPKHFKVSSTVNFFSYVNETFKVIYNFYESYHGHSICDCAASHIKRRLEKHVNEDRWMIHSSNDIVRSASTLPNVIATLAQIEKESRDCATIKGIRRPGMYMFTYEGIGQLRGFKRSEYPVTSQPLHKISKRQGSFGEVIFEISSVTIEEEDVLLDEEMDD